MERFLNDEVLYQNCLSIFYEDTAFENLGISLENKNYEDAFNYAHTLKGVTGNMGLTPLYNLLFKLVECLRSKDYSIVSLQYKEIISEYNRSKIILMPI